MIVKKTDIKTSLTKEQVILKLKSITTDFSISNIWDTSEMKFEGTIEKKIYNTLKKNIFNKKNVWQHGV